MTKEQREAKNKKPLDISWLPPAEECRVACHWEYGREFRLHFGTQRIVAGPGEDMWLNPPIVPVVKPKAWVYLSGKEREEIIAKHRQLDAIQVRNLREFLNRCPSGNDAWRHFTEGVYAVRINYRSGVETIIKEFGKWVRAEAKKFKGAPHAKAAAPPFALLKRLAAFRLDRHTTQIGRRYREVAEALNEYRKRNRIRSEGDVFPGDYAGQGAWSKACNEAAELGKKVALNEMALL